MGDALRNGANRAEFLQAVEARLRQDEEEIKEVRSTEQTPNAEWGYFADAVGKEASTFFTADPEHSPGDRNRAEEVKGLLRERRDMGERLGEEVEEEQVQQLKEELRRRSNQLRQLRRRYVVLWRRDVTNDLLEAQNRGWQGEVARLSRLLSGRGTGPRKRNYRRAVEARPTAADLHARFQLSSGEGGMEAEI
eukprot:7004344-Pyramimonas_sp.AAC.1